MEENKKINISNIDISKFRKLAEDEKLALVKSITSDADLFAFVLLNAQAKMLGLDCECENGHDFMDCPPVRYLDYEEIATSPLYDEDSEPGLYEINSKVCKRCAKLVKSKPIQLISPTPGKDQFYWK